MMQIIPVFIFKPIDAKHTAFEKLSQTKQIKETDKKGRMV